MTAMILVDELTTTLCAGGARVRIELDETVGHYIVSTDYQPRDHRATREYTTLTAARADARARLTAMARAAESTELFAI